MRYFWENRHQKINRRWQSKIRVVSKSRLLMYMTTNTWQQLTSYSIKYQVKVQVTAVLAHLVPVRVPEVLRYHQWLVAKHAMGEGS